MEFLPLDLSKFILKFVSIWNKDKAQFGPHNMWPIMSKGTLKSAH